MKTSTTTPTQLYTYTFECHSHPNNAVLRKQLITNRTVKKTRSLISIIDVHEDERVPKNVPLE